MPRLSAPVACPSWRVASPLPAYLGTGSQRRAHDLRHGCRPLRQRHGRPPPDGPARPPHLPPGRHPRPSRLARDPPSPRDARGPAAALAPPPRPRAGHRLCPPQLVPAAAGVQLGRRGVGQARACRGARDPLEEDVQGPRACARRHGRIGQWPRGQPPQARG